MSAEFYAILGLPAKAPLSLIQKAYKSAALRLHPDKNPNDPKAAERFLALADAYAVLSDPTAKAAYDEKITLEEARLARIAQMDERRRGLRETLLAREKAALSESKEMPGEAEKMAAAKFQAELERVKKKQWSRGRQKFGAFSHFESHRDDVHETPIANPVSKKSYSKPSFIEECKTMTLEEYETATFHRFKF